jgi:glycosyltransferase involved in cell wall biosynthesis
MRILQVLHFFLPRHSAGTEVYTLNLSRELARRHEVALFFSEKHISQPHYQLHRRRYQNLPCYEVVNNLCYRGFEETFSNPSVDAVFTDVLAEFEPEIVHVQHLMLLSLNLVRIARERGIPVVMTLHDFWLFCSRFGQLLRGDGSICDGPEPAKCASCLADFKFAQTSTEEKLIRAISWTRRLSGFDLAPLVGWARGSNLPLARFARRFTRRTRKPEASHSRPLEQAIRARDASVRDLIARVDLFTAPSRTVRERAIAWGVPRHKIRLARYGIDSEAFGNGHEPTPHSGPVTFGFIGTLAPHKGVHLLIQAFALLRRGSARLRVYGRLDYYPEYVRHLRELARGHEVTFEGMVPRDHVDRAFATIDCLVVPVALARELPGRDPGVVPGAQAR